ncbi:MAG: ORF6N domain-containing protein [Verrucomicrobia bacterium]|nr:ORF6N domain-containing protein [Verrucomicrobiota bacterium]
MSATSEKPATIPAPAIEELILTIRGQRVMLDSDLARLYGIATMRFNEAFKRNSARFPSDFAFQLSKDEFRVLRSQIVTSNGRGGRRHLPWVFTEHGAIMLASVLNSPVAVATSIAVVRAFVRLREFAITHREFAEKLEELEKTVNSHSKELKTVFDMLRQIMAPPTRAIGFHVQHEVDDAGTKPPLRATSPKK